MATAKKKASPAKASKKAEVLDEVEEVEEKATKGSTQTVTFGVADLAKHLEEETGKKVTTRELRTLIRKMARDGQGRVNREVIPGNRTRYDWSGIDDPEVQGIIAAFNGGELEADKKEKLAALKEAKDKKKAAKKAAEEAGEAPAKKAKKGKKAAPVEDEDDELELEDDE